MKTVEEKTAFVNEFIERMRAQIVAKVPAMPEEWDGHELKEYIGEEFYGERTHMMRTDNRRRKAYGNECAIRNL